jgi:hypothetical protein
VSVKGTRNGEAIDGYYRGVRTWAKEGRPGKAVAFTTRKIGVSDRPHRYPENAAVARVINFI